jgi:hypothetical protein
MHVRYNPLNFNLMVKFGKLWIACHHRSIQSRGKGCSKTVGMGDSVFAF